VEASLFSRSGAASTTVPSANKGEELPHCTCLPYSAAKSQSVPSRLQQLGSEDSWCCNSPATRWSLSQY